MLLEAYKPITGHLEFAFSLKLVTERWAHPEVRQVTSNQDHVRLGKLLEDECLQEKLKDTSICVDLGCFQGWEFEGVKLVEELEHGEGFG
jgi:hypothetical protein